jgi:hypothetical protein
MDPFSEKWLGRPSPWWRAVVLALPLACSSAQPSRKVTGDMADAAEPDPVAPPSRPDAAPRPSGEDRVSPDSTVAAEPEAAPPVEDAGEPVDLPVAAPDATAPPAAPSACPDLTAGWTAYQPEKSLQFEGGGSTGGIISHPDGTNISDAHCTYTNSGGVELFKMTKNPAGVRQRCEMRVKNGYRTGFQQFEGDVRVTAGDGTCVHQIFKFLMLVAYPKNGGELHQHSQTVLTSGVFGKWVHVNTVHDTAAGKVDIYIDCVKKLTMSQSPPDAADGWYHKYGVYNLGGLTAQSEWRDVRFYRK